MRTNRNVRDFALHKCTRTVQLQFGTVRWNILIAVSPTDLRDAPFKQDDRRYLPPPTGTANPGVLAGRPRWFGWWTSMVILDRGIFALKNALQANQPIRHSAAGNAGLNRRLQTIRNKRICNSFLEAWRVAPLTVAHIL